MCGIAGIATADGSTPDPRLLKAMTDCLAHRGPDGDGFLTLPGIGLGHRRLAIIDLAGGAQPMAGRRRRLLGHPATARSTTSANCGPISRPAVIASARAATRKCSST